MATFYIDKDSEFQTWFNNDFWYRNTLDDPNYYWNKVNANTKVKQLIYNHLSEKDRNEIDFKIWYCTLKMNATNNN